MDTSISIATHTKHSKQEVAVALRCANGMQTIAARYLRCSYKTIQNYLARWPDLRDVIFEAKEKTLDISEDKLFQSVRGGNVNAIVFHLKTQGKERGYVERTEEDVRTTVACEIILPSNFPKQLGQAMGGPPPLGHEPSPLPLPQSVEQIGVEGDKDFIGEPTSVTHKQERPEREVLETSLDEDGTLVTLGPQTEMRTVSGKRDEEAEKLTVAEFILKQTQEIWSRSAIKVRKLSDEPRPMEVEVLT